MENMELNNAAVETVEETAMEVVQTTKKSNKALKACGISALVAAIVTGGYLVYRKFKGKKTDESDVSEVEIVETEAEEN